MYLDCYSLWMELWKTKESNYVFKSGDTEYLYSNNKSGEFIIKIPTSCSSFLHTAHAFYMLLLSL